MLEEKQLCSLLGLLATGVDEGDGLRPLTLSVGDPTHEIQAVGVNAETHCGCAATP